MNILELINIKLPGFTTQYLIYFSLCLLTLFVIWYESAKDGFDKEKVFDFYFLSLGLLASIYYLFRYLSFYDYNIEQNFSLLVVAVFGYLTMGGSIYLTRKWKWSVYRFLDIFSFMYFVLASFLFFHQVYSFGQSSRYVYLGVYVLSYMITFLSRNKFFSGALFSIFLLLTAIFGQIYFPQQSYLLFYFSLITISMLNLVFRSKKSMIRKKLNFELLAKIRGMLLSKEKRLDTKQQKLREEDPYLVEGRDTDNAEEIDEAILEDRAKVEHDIKKVNIEGMQEQVKKALGRLEKGTYGICEVCGEPIDKSRLEAYPEATKCVKCASRENEPS